MSDDIGTRDDLISALALLVHSSRVSPPLRQAVSEVETYVRETADRLGKLNAELARVRDEREVYRNAQISTENELHRVNALRQSHPEPQRGQQWATNTPRPTPVAKASPQVPPTSRHASRDKYGQAKGDWSDLDLDLLIVLEEITCGAINPNKSLAAYVADIKDLLVVQYRLTEHGHHEFEVDCPTCRSQANPDFLASIDAAEQATP